jgi:hypothetical protein
MNSMTLPTPPSGPDLTILRAIGAILSLPGGNRNLVSVSKITNVGYRIKLSTEIRFPISLISLLMSMSILMVMQDEHKQEPYMNTNVKKNLNMILNMHIIFVQKKF